MADIIETSYTITPKWYVAADIDVIANAAGPHAVDLNITCVVNLGDVQFQVMNDLGVWFTPAEAPFTVQDSTVVRLPRANMPAVRILASADATFHVQGSLR